MRAPGSDLSPLELEAMDRVASTNCFGQTIPADVGYSFDDSTLSDHTLVAIPIEYLRSMVGEITALRRAQRWLLQRQEEAKR